MTMTKAEAKTMREALGLTPPIVAAKAGCHPNIIWRIESPTTTATVTEAVERALRELAADFDMAAERVAYESNELGTIYRPRDAASFERAVPELKGWPERTRGLFVAEVERRSTAARIEYTEE